jgi:hypothetical protein
MALTTAVVRIDQAIVPELGGGEQRRALAAARRRPLVNARASGTTAAVSRRAFAEEPRAASASGCRAAHSHTALLHRTGDRR